MALTVKDIMELPSGQRMDLIAGSGGLDRPVISVEIADYEFAPGLEFAAADFSPEENMETGSFVITSLLFARDNPSLILEAVKKLEAMGMAGLAFKRILYEELPGEVLAFAEEHRFPLFSFARDLWFENLIFDIMYAVQFDDRTFLAEDRIRRMIDRQMTASEMDIIAKGISLRLRPWVSALCVQGEKGSVDAERALRVFALHRELHSKALMVRYGQGLVVIMTSPLGDMDSHRMIGEDVIEACGLMAEKGRTAPGDGRKRPAQADLGEGQRSPAQANSGEAARPAAWAGMSSVHPASGLDLAVREGWHACLAGMAESRDGDEPAGGSGSEGIILYGDIGAYRLLLAGPEPGEEEAFEGSVLQPLEGKRDLQETAIAFAKAGGDIAAAADLLCCHQNTVRYRLGRIRQLTGREHLTDGDYYLMIKLADCCRRIREVREGL